MNKKSRIKTTLDSLFTSGKIPADETNTKAEKSVPKKKSPGAGKKVESPKKVIPEVIPEVSPQTIPVEAAPIVPAVVMQSERVETIVKDEAVETSAEKPVIPQNQPVEVKPQTPVFEKTKPDEKSAEMINSNISPESLLQKEEEHLVIFTLGKELYGVTIHSVESIIKVQAITEVPRTASYILGVTNLRGTVVPVLDLRKRFNLASSENTGNTRIVIINAEGAKVGIVVDEVTEVLKVSQDSIQPPPPMSTTIESAFINGIARINDRLVILLDLEKVLASSVHQHNR